MSYETENQAINAAIRKAKKTDEFIYVIYEAGEYDTATDYDLETFYAGANPIGCYGPDGMPA